MDLNGISKYFIGTPEFRHIEEELDKKKIVIGGLTSGSRGIFLSSLFESRKKSVLIITSNISEAEELAKDISAYIKGRNKVFYYPPLDVFPFEDISPDKNLISQRLSVLNNLLNKNSIIVVAPIRAIAERTINKDLLRENRITVKKKDEIDRSKLIKDLIKIGYVRQMVVGERGEVSVRGGIIDIFTSSYDQPFRVELLGEKVESIRFFDPISQISTGSIDEINILPVRELLLTTDLQNAAKKIRSDDENLDKIINGIYFDGIEYYGNILNKEFTSLADYLPRSSTVYLDDRIGIENTLNKLIKESAEIKNSEIFPENKLSAINELYLTFNKILKLLSDRTIMEKGASDKINTGFKDPIQFYGKVESFTDWLEKNSAGRSIFIVSKQAGRLFEILSEKYIPSSKVDKIPKDFKNRIHIVFGELSKGFEYSNIALFSDEEIFGQIRPKESYLPKPKEGVSSKLLSDLSIGDYVVHINHGVGIYRGLETLEISGAKQEYIKVEYAAEDKLYVPLHLMGMVQKYSSVGEYKPKISKLGGIEWVKTKVKAKKSIKDLTNDLIEIYSARKKFKGYSFPDDNVWMNELEQSFPYDETQDQEKAVIDVKSDMKSSMPMDRLICGDVGYGKTEVAIRAAFKAATAGKQVALLAPTTVLVEQHFRNFSKRFQPFPVVIEMLSRFRSKKEQQSVIKSIEAGAVDVVIGTHRLLQEDVNFNDLGLLIIDEEQRFGVEHKEKIKKLKKTIDVLTLTATPIPRTLYMAISGARDMSMINTPPLDRSPIKTHLYEWNEAIIHEAILRELERGGQIYFVHNFVRNIDKVAKFLKELVPTARIAVAHGQMKEKELEAVMIDFMNRKYDILLCSTIIESGIDIPSVNTIIIDHAERFGLSQLYQLRGRVGRSSIRAYAYLLYHKEKILTDSALERLKAIQEFTALGSGYKLAMKDLEIRGAGNILGAEQHGHILSIGFDLYCDLLDESVKEIKKLPEEEREKTYIDLKVNAFIPEEYVPDEKQRIALYRRMNFIGSFDELNDLKNELVDRFGKIPIALEKLLEIIVLKLEASKKRIDSIEGGPNMVKLTFREPYDQSKLDKYGSNISTYNKVLKLKTSNYPLDKWFEVVKEIVNTL